MLDLRQCPAALLTGFEVERHRLLDHGGGFLERLALADAARQIRDVRGVAALVLIEYRIASGSSAAMPELQGCLGIGSWAKAERREQMKG